MTVMAEYGHQRSTATDDLIGCWPVKIGLAAAVGVTYFLAARLGRLLLKSDGVAVFWPAAGIASGHPDRAWTARALARGRGCEAGRSSSPAHDFSNCWS
jgi:hypothetical protein